MKLRLITLFSLLTMVGGKIYAQQDPLYNLYSFNQFMINPAYAGVYNNFNANIISRKQWAGIEGAPLTNMLSLHSSVSDDFGTGLLVVNDQLGVNSNTEAQLAFSYKLFSGSKTLAFGVQGGMINYNYDYSKLNLEYLDDTGLDMNNERFTKANFGGGVFYMTDYFFVGLSVPRILNVEVNDGMTSSTRYKPHYYLSGGWVIKSKSVSEILFKPTFLVRYTSNAQLSADISMNALFANTIWAGVTLRNLNGVAVNTQLQINRKFRFGYSFELSTNKLVRDNYGTHELSLMVELNLFKDQYDIERYF